MRSERFGRLPLLVELLPLSRRLKKQGKGSILIAREVNYGDGSTPSLASTLFG